MRLVFYGTPDFAVASLEAILNAHHEVLAVVTAPDKPAGRGHKLQTSAVKTFALANGLSVLQPTNLKSPDFLEQLRDLNPDIQIVVAFRMLPESVWNLPPKGTYNVHGSLLPNYRGAAPINWAIVNGEKETGVTTFKLQHEIDTGSILLQKKTPIGPDETAGDIYARLMKMGAELIVESLSVIESGNAILHPQSPKSSDRPAPKIKKSDAKVDWSMTRKEVHDLVRGMNPFPGAYCHALIKDQKVVWKIHATQLSNIPNEKLSVGLISFKESKIFVGCSDGPIEILSLQPEGKRKMSASEFINGFREDISDVRLN